ncbi:trypsin Blo t 3-like isoform X5 [Daphnia pulicaria]|uniref:trypsin Blo t 3-like isoform X5 n=1 Tax=Daphnia pulicaria TaxID=35523 RepID=UPI001EEC7CD5|nr:trypsin Blo t 3-like isoform X5 [Daphnia pulicaria]
MRFILLAMGLFSLVGIVVSSRKAAVAGNVPSVSIYGGTPALLGEFPYMAYLELGTDGYFCGGTLISSTHVLTARHCLSANQSYASTYTVRVNTLELDGSTPGAIARKVKKIILHPNYDIGLLVLRSAVTTIKPIPLPSPLPPTTTKKPGTTKVPTKITTPFYSCACAPLSEYADMNAVVTGWGYRAPGEPSTTALLKTNVTIHDNSVCIRQYGIGAIDTDHKLCASAPGKDTCNGDSGGPIIVNGVLVGVTSGGMDCDDPYYAGIYVRLRPFLDWIKKNMANNPG